MAQQAIFDAVLDGNPDEVAKQVDGAIRAGATPDEILKQGLIAPMGVLGQRMADGEAFIPEVLMSANAMRRGLEIVKPLLGESGRTASGVVVLGTVRGDIHDIGKTLVRFMLEGNGFDVIDLGVDVDEDRFVEAVREHEPDVLGMSALLTTTMPNMGRVIERLKECGLREKVRVIVGGASVNAQFADSIGADGFAPEAGSAVRWVRSHSAERDKS